MQNDSVLVVDPQGISRVGMQLFLAGELGVKVLGAATFAEMQAVFQTQNEVGTDDQIVDEGGPGSIQVVPKICLVNIGAPWGAGFELLQGLKVLETGITTIALGNCGKAGFDVLARDAGADIIFDRRAGTRRLMDLVRRLLSGNHTSASLLADHNPSKDAPTQKSPRAILSRREHEVFTLMAGGAATRDIAASLHISVKTVASHRARIMEKIHLRDHADLIRYALRTGVIE